MNVRLAVSFRGTTVDVEVAVEDPAACVADLVAGLEGGGAALGVALDGQWFGPDIGLHEIGLYEGAAIEIATRDVAPEQAWPRPGGLALAVVGGPAAGRTHVIDRDVVIGRDPSCAIVVADPSVSPRHALVTTRAEVVDLGSTNGTWIDDKPVVGPTAVDRRSIVRLGATQLQLRTFDRDDRPAGLPSGAFVPFNRPPRPAPRPTPDPLVAPDAPKPSTASRAIGIATTIGPVVMGAGMVVIYRDPRLAVFAALAPAMATVNWIANKRTTRKERRRGDRTFNAALTHFADDLERRADDERARLGDELVDAAEVVRRAALPSITLWQRRPPHADFLRLRAGLGTVPWAPAAISGREPPPAAVAELLDRASALSLAPVELDLSGGGVAGIVGDRHVALALARSLVCQAAVHHGPADLSIAVFGGDEWDWVKWLPHLDRDPLQDIDSERAVLVVVDDVAALEGRRAPVRQLLGRHSGIVIAPTEDQLPAMCTSVVTVHDDLGTAELRRPQDRLHLTDLHLAGMDDDTARTCARALARYEDPELDVNGNALPAVVRLLPLVGLADPTPEGVRAAWATSNASTDDPPPATAIGVSADGAVHVDLVNDGPHCLIGGTTGSGKSELLRSLVAGMAARVDPDHLVFVLVDYKGGSAFDECARLPHVVGLVTDLDEQLAERALRSLEAELRHRERVLRESGAVDLPAYLHNGSPRGPLPRLVVVIDEFATMASELPDFLGALVGIAQRGRSLGVHLVLATQRPSGAVNANIKANTNLRIALRVQDGNDSTDIIDRPSAASISRATPGRAYIRHGPADVVLAQTALSTGTYRPGSGVPIRVSTFRRITSDPSLVDDRDCPTELAVLVDAVGVAFTGRSLPRRPWLPMLPERVDGDAVRAIAFGVIAFALADEPDRQRQVAAGWDPTDGHFALFGMFGSGTTTALLSLVDALARRYAPEECHIYALDFGSNGLAPLRGVPHVGAVLTANEHEAQNRHIRHLRAEVERRRATGDTAPLIVTGIDGVAAFLAEHDTIESNEIAEAFRRVFAEGPAVGIVFAVTADRIGALPLRLASLVSQKLLFRLADPSDYSVLGLRPAQLPRFVPGRAIHSDGLRVVQVAVPRLDDITGRRVAPPIETLPADVSWSVLPPACIHCGVRLPVGVAEADLETAWLRVHDGEHVLVTGPPRSGKTNALAAMANALRRASADIVLVAVCAARSSLSATDAFDAAGTAHELEPMLRAVSTHNRMCFVFVDDAPLVDDANGAITGLLRTGRADLHVVAAGRTDDVRAAYGHWLRIVRQSRCGLLLQPDLAADGDLLGVRLPRRVPVAMVPGRGFAVENGIATLVQTARA